MRRFRSRPQAEETKDCFSHDNPEGDHHLCPGATPVAQLIPRQRATVCGLVRSTVLLCNSEFPRLEVELQDGSGSIVLVFRGYKALAGVTPGTHVSATGLVADRDDQQVMCSPVYTLHS